MCAFGLPNIMTLTSECRERLNETEKKLLDKVAKSVIDLSGKPQVSIEDMLNYIRQICELTQGRKDYNFGGITGEDLKTFLFQIQMEQLSNVAVILYDQNLLRHR